jgi:hypothetical protein
MNIEQKHIFMAAQHGVIRDWLEYVCVRDPKYYAGTVSSIYFDTPSLYHYFEKRNSDYTKSKIRLRWYGTVDSDPEGKVRCFVEHKHKYGTIRQKERKEIFVAAKSLLNDPLSAKEILRIPSEIYDLDYLPPGILIPILAIQYDRFRYVEPHTGARVALDLRIRCSHANSDYIAGEAPVNLNLGVVEVKGSKSDLPSVFRPIHDYLTREAFSKYARCCEKLLQPVERRL